MTKETLPSCEVLWRLRQGDRHGEIRVTHGSVNHDIEVEVAGQIIGRAAVPPGKDWTQVADDMLQVCLKRGWTPAQSPHGE
jgi:hypothetical protein